MLQSIQRWGLLDAGEHVVVAFSGGPDSTALLALLSEVALDWNLTLTAAHLDHGINRELGEVAWKQTQQVAADLGAKWVGKREDVRRLKGIEGGSLHQVARRVRYEFFTSVASQVGARVVATGHTADDQAETVLMRVLRGAGPLGACGIPPRRRAGEATIIRPLLAHRRSDLIRFCTLRGLPYVDDPANVEGSFLRSRVRLEVLPNLAKAFGHDVVPHLAAFAERLREEQEVLSGQAESLMNHPGVERTSVGFTFPRGLLADQPPGLLKLLVLRVLEACRGKAPRLKAAQLEAVVGAAARPEGGRTITLSEGWEVSFGSHFIRMGAAPPSVAPIEPVVLNCPGSTEVAEMGVRLHVRTCPAAPEVLPPERAHEAYIAAGAVRGGLNVRRRRPGDTIAPLGAPGRRKLKKVMIDRKIPRTERDRVPIITTGAPGEEEVLWAVGVALGESCRVLQGCREVWHVKVEPL